MAFLCSKEIEKKFSFLQRVLRKRNMDGEYLTNLSSVSRLMNYMKEELNKRETINYVKFPNGWRASGAHMTIICICICICSPSACYSHLHLCVYMYIVFVSPNNLYLRWGQLLKQSPLPSQLFLLRLRTVPCPEGTSLSWWLRRR